MLEVFGGYELFECIGRGGMGEVFRARRRDDYGRLVAVKRVHRHLIGNGELVSMFLDEAQLAVAMRHRNIAAATDIGYVRGQSYIALEHIHGRTMRQVLQHCRSVKAAIPTAIACHVLIELCDGLQYAHTYRDDRGRLAGLVHRDISPDNVMVSFEGETKIIDFGIAKVLGDASLSTFGVVKGKLGYMAPEQLRWLPVDQRTDVFSCGVVLLELLTGRPVFNATSVTQNLARVHSGHLPRPSASDPEIPGALEAIILKAMALRPENRYQSAAELGDALRSFLCKSRSKSSAEELAAWLRHTFRDAYADEVTRIGGYLDGSVSKRTQPKALHQENSLLQAMPTVQALNVYATIPDRVVVQTTLPGFPAPVPAARAPLYAGTAKMLLGNGGEGSPGGAATSARRAFARTLNSRWQYARRRAERDPSCSS